MRVSVIILNHNGKKFIASCINSVLKSSFSNFEIVILDNASTDNSYIYLKKKYGSNSKVKLYRSNKQLYFTGGNNYAADKATGNLLFFLNSDTVIDKECIKNLVNSIDKNKTLVQPKILFYNEPNIIDNIGGHYDNIGIAHAIGRGQGDYGQYNKKTKLDYVNGTAFIIPKSLFKKLSGFSKRYRYYYEDVDLCLRAKKFGYSCKSEPSALVYHKNSLTFTNNVPLYTRKYYYLRNRFLTAIKHHPIYLIPFMLPVWVLLYIINYIPSVNQLRFNELRSYIKKQKYTLLDLGSGNGNFVQTCRNQGVNAMGVDKTTNNKSHFINSTIEGLNIKHKYDIVTMYHVLEHTNKPELILQKVKSLLNREGTLVLEVPLVGNYTEKLLGKDYFAYHDKTHRHFFTKQAIFNLIENTGFSIIGKGLTLYEFPTTIITTSLRQSRVKTIVGLFLFLPLKILSILGYNDEIIRLYCKVKT